MQENPILVLQSMITEHGVLLAIETHLQHPGQINTKKQTLKWLFFSRCKKVLIPSGSDQFSHASSKHFVNFSTAGISLFMKTLFCAKQSGSHVQNRTTGAKLDNMIRPYRRSTISSSLQPIMLV